jgi:hypothetical protein
MPISSLGSSGSRTRVQGLSVMSPYLTASLRQDFSVAKIALRLPRAGSWPFCGKGCPARSAK